MRRLLLGVTHYVTLITPTPTCPRGARTGATMSPATSERSAMRSRRSSAWTPSGPLSLMQRGVNLRRYNSEQQEFCLACSVVPITSRHCCVPSHSVSMPIQFGATRILCGMQDGAHYKSPLLRAQSQCLHAIEPFGTQGSHVTMSSAV